MKKKSIYESKYRTPYVKICEAHEALVSIADRKFIKTANKLLKVIVTFEKTYYGKSK